MSRTHQSGSSTVWSLVLFATLALFAAALYTIFVVAPVEQQMGIVQKIFYFHVPSAYAMYIGFFVSAVASGVYLLKRDARWDAIAVAGAEVGTLFCLIVLLTGPLWARKAWGVWWTWDPRLTTTLLSGMIFAAYLALRSMGDTGEVEKRFASGLALLGLVNLPLIHYSVQRWRGVHPTVITGKGGGLESEMYWALGLSFMAFTGLAVLLIWARASVERQREESVQLRLELMHR
ncbi:MAG: heme transporter [Myxococcales bacterium]|jgi:heme exporter protein C|nr:cytochrome c biogenesis protein CcsA [Deltaproteobacteria bacterium]MBW2189050.1 cytochrome c biogenesis protein CcsA [Deltaproteobacteria bacterium]MBW2402750.1 cytochrome c biogenesis protein CcsA [Deltaproteobacteria bacterium]MBW2717155.1 cytochrome c biogenesis protein CcsA [Deltaproteobacteria bacterium]NOQ83015.1 heme transporter [Myxococcales bacterium]